MPESEFFGLVLLLVVIGLAVVGGRYLYRTRGSGAAVVNSATSLLGLTVWTITAIYIMIGGGTAGILLGGLILLVAVYVGSYHVKVLTEADVRSALAGDGG